MEIFPFRITPQPFVPPAQLGMQDAFGIFGGILKTRITKSLTERLIGLFSAIFAKNSTRIFNGNLLSQIFIQGKLTF
jgi:hypothetical protein